MFDQFIASRTLYLKNYTDDPFEQEVRKYKGPTHKTAQQKFSDFGDKIVDAKAVFVTKIKVTMDNIVNRRTFRGMEILSQDMDCHLDTTAGLGSITITIAIDYKYFCSCNRNCNCFKVIGI